MLCSCLEACIKPGIHTALDLFDSHDYTPTGRPEDIGDSPIVNEFRELENASQQGQKKIVESVQFEERRSIAASSHKMPSFLDWMGAMGQQAQYQFDLEGDQI